MRLIEKLFSGLQHLLPHRLLSRLVHAFMRIRLAPVKNLQIAVVGGLVGVDWTESKLRDAADFAAQLTPVEIEHHLVLGSPVNWRRASGRSTRIRKRW